MSLALLAHCEPSRREPTCHTSGIALARVDRPAAAVEFLIVLVAGHGLLRPAGRVASGGDGHGQDGLAGQGRDDCVEAAVTGHGLDDHGRVARGTGLAAAISTVAPGAVFPLTVAWVCWVVRPGSWLARMSSVIPGQPSTWRAGSPPRRVP